MESCDYVCKEPRNICADIPFALEEIFVVNGVCSDDSVEQTLLVCFVKLLDCIACEEWKGNCCDNLCSSVVVEEFHGLEQSSACTKHVVCKESNLALNITKKLYALDVCILCILCNNRIVSLLVDHGERLLESCSIELVAVDGTCVR